MKLKNLFLTMVCSTCLLTFTACDDDDDDKEMPKEVVEAVQNSLKEIFPNFSSLEILDIDYDKEDIEVDVRDGKLLKEVKLNKKYQWIETKYDVTMADAMKIIQPETLAKLTAMAKAGGIDITDPAVQKGIQVEVHESAAKGLYFEVELEVAGQDFDVTIDKDGNIQLGD